MLRVQGSACTPPRRPSRAHAGLQLVVALTVCMCRRACCGRTSVLLLVLAAFARSYCGALAVCMQARRSVCAAVCVKLPHALNRTVRNQPSIAR